jgi:hypothetical protein
MWCWIRNILKNNGPYQPEEKMNLHYLFRFLLLLIHFSFFTSSFLIAETSLFSTPQAPVQSEDQFLLSFGRLGPGNDFISRDLHAPSRFQSECAITNMHNRKAGLYEIDAETYVCGLRYERSLGEKARISFFSSLVHVGGGVFDSSIRHFHNMFSFPNGPRRADNQNRYRGGGRLDSGEEFVIEREGLGLRDPVIAVSVPVFSVAEDNVVSLEGAGSIPLGLSEFSLSLPDFKLSLVWQRAFSWITFATGASSVLHLDSNQFGIEYERVHYGAFFSSTIPVNETFEILLGVMYRSGMVRDVSGFPGYAMYLDTGVRINYFKDSPVEIVLRENPVPGKGTADVSIFFRYGF